MLYMGSKSRLRNDILDILYTARYALGIDRYYELFMGGCNIIGYVDFKEKYGSNLNKYLVAFIEELKQNGIKNITPRITREQWYDVRYNKEKYEDWYYFYCMNFWYFRAAPGRGYNHLWYENGLDRADILAGELSKLTSFDAKYADYRDVEVKAPSIIYLDPPYKGTNDYSLFSGKFNHKEFYEYAQELAKENFVLISEYNMPKQFQRIKTMEVQSMSNNKYICYESLFVVRGGYGVKEVMDVLNSNDTDII